MKGRKKKLIIGIVAFILLCGAAVLVGSFVFDISAVEFTGNGLISSEELFIRSGIELGSNIFVLDEKEIEQRLEREGDITVLNIERIFPSTVRISVTVRRECAQIYWGPDRYFSLDENGELIRVHTADPQLIELTGLGQVAVYPDGKIETEEPKRFECAVRVMQAFAAQGLLDKITLINAEDVYNVMLETTWGYKVNIGSMDRLENKIKDLPQMVEVLRQNDKNGGTINVKTDGGYTYSAE